MRTSGSEAAKGVTSGSLNELEDPQVRARIAAVLASPELQRAMKDLSAGLSQGVVEGLSNDQLAARIDTLVARFTKVLFVAIGQGIDSPENQAKAGRFAGAVVAAAMKEVATQIPRSIAPAVERALADGIGPGVRDLMRKELTPALTELLRSPEFKAAVGETARTVAHDAVLGSNAALDELDEQQKHQRGGSPLGGLFALFAARSWLLVLLGSLVVFGIPLLWLIHEQREARRFREDAERRSARADALLRAIEIGETRFSPGLVALLREQLLRAEEQEATERARPSRHSIPSRPSHA